jgi:hypothetical protein
MIRIYVTMRKDGKTVVSGRTLSSLAAEDLAQVHGAVVQEHIRRENVKAKALLDATRKQT